MIGSKHGRAAVAAAIVLVFAALTSGQEGLAGRWQGETDGGASILLDLTVKGSALTGTLTRNGQRTDLSDGKVAKDRFSFKATLNERSEGFSGEFADGKIRLWLDRQGPTHAVVLTRVTAK